MRNRGPVIFVLLAARLASGQEKKPGNIQDNSFLIEEAYNQERGVIQEIQNWWRFRDGTWLYTLTQEWPVPDERNQLSFTLPIQHLAQVAATGVGDLALNYRYQLVGGSDANVALAPRLTVLLPTGSSKKTLGAGNPGLQGSIPLSVVLSESLVSHWNVGATWFHHARNASGQRSDTASYDAGGSLIWLARPTLNLMLETLFTSVEFVNDTGNRERRQDLFLSPGLRFALNFKGGLQVVPGVAFPLGVGPSHGQRSVFLYLSFEHPIPRLGG